jgi:hypothetical protein
LYQESVQIRSECEKARCEMEMHRHEHGC